MIYNFISISNFNKESEMIDIGPHKMLVLLNSSKL